MTYTTNNYYIYYIDFICIYLDIDIIIFNAIWKWFYTTSLTTFLKYNVDNCLCTT